MKAYYCGTGQIWAGLIERNVNDLYDDFSAYM
jgi:hypothetical protein